MSAADSQVRRKLCHLREFQFSALSQRPLRLSGSISHTKNHRRDAQIAEFTQSGVQRTTHQQGESHRNQNRSLPKLKTVRVEVPNTGCLEQDCRNKERHRGSQNVHTA